MAKKNVSRDRKFMSKAERDRYKKSGYKRKTSFKVYQTKNNNLRKKVASALSMK